MDKKHARIKLKRDYYTSVIKNALTEMDILKEEQCEHPDTEIVPGYDFCGRIIENAEVCKICGKLLTDPYPYICKK